MNFVGRAKRDKMKGRRARATGVVALAWLVFIAATGCASQEIKIYPVGKHQTVALGKSVVLTCQVEGQDPALVTQMQWLDPRHNVIKEAMLGTRPEIYIEPLPAKQLQLYISSITPAMAGDYTCVATYSNMPLNNSVRLDTFLAITWTNANENQYATKGKDYTVMCDIAAEPAPSVSWFKEDMPLNTGERYIIHAKGLLIKNIQESDDGTYTCRAVVIQTGELGERHIKLEVYTAPEMEARETRVVLREGETASVTCKARGTPPPVYTWIKSSTRENLATTSRFSVNENTGQLTFDRVGAGDYGKYICSAANRAGQNETAIEVEVLVPPKIFELYNTTAAEQNEGRLECKASGRPAPKITFRKHSTDMPFLNGPNEEGRIVVESSTRPVGDQMQTFSVMSIMKLTRMDDGLYECVAFNDGGEARKNGLLTVQFKPTFENMPPGPVWTWNSQPVNISCLAESIPNATIKWRFRDLDLVETPHTRIYGSGPYSYVTVTPTDRSLYGHYKCIATNTLGEAVYDIELREAFVPGLIPQVRQEALTATSVSFTILDPSEEMGPPILAYTVQYKENGNYDWTFAQNRTWSLNSPYIIENLKPLSSYDFRFAAVNQVGAGLWSSPQTVHMPKRSPPEPPKWRENITLEDTVYGKFPDHFELKWKIPAHNGEPIDLYEFRTCPVLKMNGEWRIVSQNDCYDEAVKSYEAISYDLRNLKPDTSYRVSVRAHNILGFSSPTHMFFQTAPGVERSGFASAHILSSGAIIGLALAGVFICLVVVDLLLLCTKQTGVIATIWSRRQKKNNEDDSKLGSDEKEPLKDNPMKRNSSIEFDGHRAYTTSGGPIIGKNSAV